MEAGSRGGLGLSGDPRALDPIVFPALQPSPEGPPQNGLIKN